MNNYLKGRCEEGGSRLFSMMPSVRTRGIGHKMNQRRLCLNTRKPFFTVRVREHWHRMPRDVVERPSLEALKSCLDIVQDVLQAETQHEGRRDSQGSGPEVSKGGCMLRSMALFPLSVERQKSSSSCTCVQSAHGLPLWKC